MKCLETYRFTKVYREDVTLMGGDPWVYDKIVHSNKNNNKLIQLLCTAALNKAIYSGVGGVER